MPVRKKKLDICAKCERSGRQAITAAKSGHVNCLSTAYKDLGVINERDDYDATPIHYAARFGKLNCLEWLVNCSGVSPNAASTSGSTAAHEAASKGHLDCLRYLILNTNCSAQDRTHEGATVFHIACRFGRSNCVKFLLEQAECSPCDKGTSNVTPVHICAAHNHLVCLKQLTQRADYVPNQVTVHGATPTYFAAQEGSLDCLMWLVDKADGDLYKEATDGMRPIHASAQGGKLECIKWMVLEANLPADLKAADGATPAHFSAASGQIECLEWLLDNGGSVADRDDLGGTPAHDAAEQGQIEALELLVNKGADVSIIDDEGLSPMDVAKENQQDECVEMLFKITQPVFTLTPTPHEEDNGQAFSQEDAMSPTELERRQVFEESMMSEMNEDQREAVWSKAKFQPGVKLSPGLKLLLAGEEEPESNISIDIPTGSLRHSRHSSVCSRLSTRKENTRSPLTDEVFKIPSKDIKENENTAIFSTFKSDTKVEDTVKQPEQPDVVDGPPNDKRSFKRKESFLKRLFSRKRSSSSVLQGPPTAQKKKHHSKDGNDSRSSLKEKATLQERIEFYQTALTVEVFDDNGTTMPAISEEAQHTDAVVATSGVHTTIVEINSTPDAVANCQTEADDFSQAAVKTVAESVAENVVNQAILVVENDITRPATTEDDKSQPRSKTSTKAPKVKGKKKKGRKTRESDAPVEKAMITHDRASTSYSSQLVETVKVDFTRVDQDLDIKTPSSSDSDYTTSESSESDSNDDEFGTKPMNIEEFEKFGEDVDKQKQRELEFNHVHGEKQSADDTSSNTHSASILHTPNNALTDDVAFNQPTNGIPSTVVRAIHRDLQVLSESIDKDLDKLLNDNDEQDDDLLKMDEDVSSSVSDIALEKLEEAQVISHIPLIQSTPKEAVIVQKENADDLTTATSTESKNLTKQLSSSSSTTDNAPNATTASSTEPAGLIKRLSNNLNEAVTDRKVVKSPSFEGKARKRGSSIQEKMKLFGEKIPELTIAVPPLQSSDMVRSQQADTNPLDTKKIEEDDVVTPLKSISGVSLRRGSLPTADKLKFDGLIVGETLEPSSLEAKKQKWRLSPLELTNTQGSPVAERRFVNASSPLHPRRASQKHDPEHLELFMKSANLDYLTSLHEKTREDAKLLAIKRAKALLEDPAISKQSIPDAFREVLLQINKKFIWCVMDTWYSWLELMDELPVELDSEECYMFLHIQDLGPLKYHIFLWIGNQAKDSSIKSTYSWCIKLLQCLPGRPVVYREAEGHESSLFQITFQDVLIFNQKSVMYYNDTLDKPTLFRYRGTCLTEIEACAHHLGEDSRDIMLLATSSNLFIWLLPQTWHTEPAAIWEAANVYLTKHDQPLWAPLTILTQHGETKDFCAHLCGWQHANLHLSGQVDQLMLAKRKRQTIRYPAVGKLKIWLLKGSTQSLLPLDKLGQFKSTNAYLVEFKFQRWQTLFLWVGNHINYELNDNGVLKAAVDLCKKMNSKPELTLIPQGLETKEFLNLFKGKCVIWDPKLGSDIHLYQVSGTDILRIKTTEVKPVASSLNSSHSYILSYEQQLFAWSGQFSNQAERRGALILCNIVGHSESLPTLLTEGMETQEFWSLLDGKTDYSHCSNKNEIPDYYENSIYLYESNHFVVKHKLTKSDLMSTDILLIWTTNEIYLWTGSKTDVDATTSLRIVTDYIKHNHSKNVREFVIHLLNEGCEPQHFWDLFTFSSTLQSPSSIDVLKRTYNDEPSEDDHDEIDSLVSDINSMVVNLSTSSVPNINEIGKESDRVLSIHRERFKLMKDSPLSQSCQAELQYTGVNDVSADGLKSSAKQGASVMAKKKETQPKRQKWSLKVDPAVYQWLTVPAVHHDEVAQKTGGNSKQRATTKGYMMNVTVEDQTGASASLVVDSSIAAIALAFLAASKLHLALTKDLTLFEVVGDIGIERIIEDHELIKDVVSLWPKKSSTQLVVKELKDKHQLWLSSQMEEEVRGFTENDTVTRETFTMSSLKKKSKWQDSLYCFRHDGVYSMAVGEERVAIQQQALVAKFSTHNVYVASKLARKRPLSGPTSFGLVLKPTDSFKEKDCTVMCAQDSKSWMKWIQMFRLFKHGAQLKGNYLAVLARLKARRSKAN